MFYSTVDCVINAGYRGVSVTMLPQTCHPYWVGVHLHTAEYLANINNFMLFVE
jgi:hypothetical protein